MPTVTAVVAMHNAAPYLTRTLASLSAQTLDDLEVVCVDDASRDDSADLVRRHAEADPRFRLLGQSHAGAGAARNRGLEAARGRYVAFLDADDLLDPGFLEAAVARLDDTGADFCVVDGAPFSGSGPEQGPAGRYLRRGLLPPHDPFAPTDVPGDALFQFATPAAWLRVFRRDFLDLEGLRFAAGHVPDDLCFTTECTAAATSITVLDRVLVHYRVGHGGAMTSRWDEDPFRVERVLDDLSRRLASRGALPAYAASLRVLCLDALVHVLRRLRTARAYEEFHEAMRDRLLAKYGILKLDPEAIPLPFLRADLRTVLDTPARRSPLHPSRRGRATPTGWAPRLRRMLSGAQA